MGARPALLLSVVVALGLAACSVNTQDPGSPVAQPSVSATATPTPSVDTDPLSAYNLWTMTPEERLQAITIDKILLKSPEAFAKRYVRLECAILNAGTSDEEYAKWSAANSEDTTADYGQYIFDTYTEPLFVRLLGQPINRSRVTNPRRQLTHIIWQADYARDLGFKVGQYTTECSFLGVRMVNGDYLITREEKWPQYDWLDVAIVKIFGSDADPLRKSMMRKMTYESLLKDVQFNAELGTVQAKSPFTWHKVISVER